MARFILSAPNLAGCPKDGRGEIAFIGRSNVGKSSLLGALLQHPSLVRRSATPGRTQLINYFETTRHERVVDLPGYGFAKVPPKVHQAMQDLVQEYIAGRDQLIGVVLLVDARRDGPSPDDKAWFEFAQESGRRVQVVMTKCDRISKAERKPHLKHIADGFVITLPQLLSVSATSGEGLPELSSVLRRWREVAKAP